MGVKSVEKNYVILEQMTNDLYHLQYPIGKFIMPDETSFELIKSWVDELNDFPSKLISLTSSLTSDQLEKTYRPGGWTARQVIHHVADSHLNAYTRFKLTLTEDKPTIRPYFEDRWAELSDGKTGKIELSLPLIAAIHARLVSLLKTLEYSDFSREYIHPETQQTYTLAYLAGTYAWHGNHHLAHLQLALSQTKSAL